MGIIRADYFIYRGFLFNLNFNFMFCVDSLRGKFVSLVSNFTVYGLIMLFS